MYFKSVRIKNYRAIRDLQINFEPGVNLLIGDNGVGKTSILDALTVVLGGFLSGIAGVSSKGILQTDIHIVSTKLGDASAGIQYLKPASIECTMDIDGTQYTWARTREDESSDSHTKITDRKIVTYAKEIANDLDHSLPLLSYMGTTRVSQPKRGDFGSSSRKKLNDRRCGYIGCLESALDVKAIKAWCLKMEMASVQQQRKITEYEAFKKSVSSFMKRIGNLDFDPSVFYSFVFEDLVYEDHNTTLPISYLSAGYQSLLWIAMNLSYRMALLNPGQVDFMQATGIVMIDELDMHLHPKWQWNALVALEELFPNVQFIIATHSPIIISSCKNERLIKIDREQTIIYPESAYAYSVEDVLEFRQESQGVPLDVREATLQFENALNNEKYEDARKILGEMLKKYGENNREVKSAMLELGLGTDGDE